MRSGARAALLLAASATTLAGCGPQHQLARQENGDRSLVATTDYFTANLGLTHDVAVSVQERQGLASGVATFRNVPQTVAVTWLGPEDLNVCPQGSIVGYRTAVVLNTLSGKRTVHVHYDCTTG